MISTVVAAYNSEKTIKRCLDSLLMQKDEDIEIIVINDGSKDKTLEILNSYNDKRLIVKTIENSGVSVARNNGIQLVSGDYITFVDSDDYVVVNYYSLIKNLIELYDTDFYIYCAYRHENNDKKYKPWDLIGKPGVYSDMEEIYNLVGIRYTFPVVWNKVYKSDIIKNNNIFFEEDKIFGEDLLFNLEYSKCINNFCMSKLAIYHYMISKNNATNNQKLKYLEDRDYSFNKMLEFCEPSKKFKLCKEQLTKIFIEKFYVILMGLQSNKNIKRQDIIESLNKSTAFELIMNAQYADKRKKYMQQAMHCYLNKQFAKMHFKNLALKVSYTKSYKILRKIFKPIKKKLR